MKTEFNNPEDELDHEDDGHFKMRSIRQKETTAALHLNVIKYRGIAQITGIAGRMELDARGLRELIEDLEAAEEFIEANPPRRGD